MARQELHLVFGAAGQMGSELVRMLAPVGRVVGLTRAEADLERLESVREAIRTHAPAIVWNAAAATSVDAVELDPELASHVNATAPGVMAEEAKRVGAVLVHFSTDYVFDGAGTTPYTEADTPRPLSIYGLSKFAGECAVQDVEGSCLILRTGWLYSPRGRNFLTTVMGRGVRGEPLRVVNDQIGAPTSSRELASACVRLVPSLLQDRAGSLLLHASAGGRCSWYDFATAIRDEVLDAGGQWPGTIEPIATTEHGARAIRPVYSVLSNDLFADTYGFRMADWRMPVRDVVRCSLGLSSRGSEGV